MKFLTEEQTPAVAVNWDRPVRIGILGCADIAVRKFIPALVKCTNATLQAVSSRTPETAAKLCPNQLIQTHEELLASALVDLVYLPLPNHLHEEWSIKALEAGKHLICEKPLSTSLAVAEKILDCAKQNRRLIYENQMFLFHPQHAAVKAIISAGDIGKIKELRSFFGFPLPQKGDFRLDKLQGGGAFHDLARYPLGIAAHLFKALPEGFRGHSTWHNGLNTAVAGTAISSENETLTFSIAFGQQYEASYEVVGEKGKIRLERAYTTPADYENRIILTTGSKITEIRIPPVDHFKLMIEAICHKIQSGCDYAPLNLQAATIARLADLMEKGCMENRHEL